MLEGHVGRLYVGFEGSAAEVDWMVEQFRIEWATAGATAADVGAHCPCRTALALAAEFPADLQIAVLPSATVETIAKVLEINPNCAIQAHAGDGVIRIKPAEGKEERGEGRGLGTSVPSGATADDASVLVALRRVAAAASGTMIVLRNPDGVAFNAADVWGPPGPEFPRHAGH